MVVCGSTPDQRLSPGPGELPVIPSVAILQPPKQLEFRGRANEPLTSSLLVTNVSYD